MDRWIGTAPGIRRSADRWGGLVPRHFGRLSEDEILGKSALAHRLRTISEVFCSVANNRRGDDEMGQRSRIITEILDLPGWKVAETYFEARDGARVLPMPGHPMALGTTLVLLIERRWASRCSHCDAIGATIHERLSPRRWNDRNRSVNGAL